ncbi:unnamed protein product [Didymodactylos carnosus]|uniref:Potassium channel domain-containing protein n=1 Tax=Didymodactylos carnosus TaxID=1234261 RepID=A0A813YEP9_9BILA|nr:unnamed protein product [Didymodactylos carnosus]CAF1427834.1 unnamed protein product [Didymodactylos carnosus]CAF3668902.1 unnamed protein product [Didymodactylos carnosus]CAF4226587.1 unnamed protein product [Didymodactylos carnosus]
MSKKFNIREYVIAIKYWSLLFIPHLAISLIFLIYTFVGASIIQEIESQKHHSVTTGIVSPVVVDQSSNVKIIEREREKLLSKLLTKRQAVDLQTYANYIRDQLLEYEEEVKECYRSTAGIARQQENQLTDKQKQQWSFTGSLYFIGSILTTIGYGDYAPASKVGKLFVMIYASLGIPLTLVLLSDLSILLTRFIKYSSSVFYRLYSTSYFLQIRSYRLIRFIEEKLGIVIILQDVASIQNQHHQLTTTTSTVDEDYYDLTEDSSRLLKLQPPPRRKRLSIALQTLCGIVFESLDDVSDNFDLTLTQLIVTLIIYIFFGACLFSQHENWSLFDSFYFCYISLFTIGLNLKPYKPEFMLISSIYILFGLAFVSLCIQTVQINIKTVLVTAGNKTLRDLIEFLKQMGFHELSTEDLLTENFGRRLTATIESPLISQRYRPNQCQAPSFSEISQENTNTNVPTASAIRSTVDPLRRLSTGLLMRAFKSFPGDANNFTVEKSVQVNTIIRSCGRCSGANNFFSNTTSLSNIKKHSPATVTTSIETSADPSPMTLEVPPSMERLRKRRATLVAQTIINQMAIQQPILQVKTDESYSATQSNTTVPKPPTSFRYNVTSTTTKPYDNDTTNHLDANYKNDTLTSSTKPSSPQISFVVYHDESPPRHIE